MARHRHQTLSRGGRFDFRCVCSTVGFLTATESAAERHSTRGSILDGIRIKRVAVKIVGFCIRRMPFAVLAALCLIAAAAISAHAGLGGDATSIDSDAVAMRGTMAPPTAAAESAPTASSYRVRSFVSGDGVTVREYAASSGPVFGVAWQGRRPPDLSILLGSYYSEYTSAASPRRHVNLHHAVIKGPNSIIVMGGHMGHIVGRAYVPGLAPSGVDARAVVK